MRRDRAEQIVEVLVDAFADLIEADPRALRRKFRKMAQNPFSFYRGSACLFCADVAHGDDPYADERTSRVWILRQPARRALRHISATASVTRSRA
jgi:hypothetical protein